jgi:hypothetical protein
MRYSTNLKRHSIDKHLLLHKLIRIGVNGEIFFYDQGDIQENDQQRIASCGPNKWF